MPAVIQKVNLNWKVFLNKSILTYTAYGTEKFYTGGITLITLMGDYRKIRS